MTVCTRRLPHALIYISRMVVEDSLLSIRATARELTSAANEHTHPRKVYERQEEALDTIENGPLPEARDGHCFS